MLGAGPSVRTRRQRNADVKLVIAATVAVLLSGFVIAARHLRRASAAAGTRSRAVAIPSAPPTESAGPRDRRTVLPDRRRELRLLARARSAATSSRTRRSSPTAARCKLAPRAVRCAARQVMDVDDARAVPGEHRSRRSTRSTPSSSTSPASPPASTSSTTTAAGSDALGSGAQERSRRFSPTSGKRTTASALSPLPLMSTMTPSPNFSWRTSSPTRSPRCSAPLRLRRT